MDPREEDVELLVHITAPATTASDGDHRQLARAYVNFSPSRATTLPSPGDSGITSSVDVVEDSFAEETSKQDDSVRAPLVRCTPAAGEATHVRDTGGGSSAASALTSEPTTGENVQKSVEHSGRCRVVPGSQVNDHGDESLIEEVPDSYPVGSVTLDPFVSPTRMLEHHLRRMESAPWPPKRALELDADETRPNEVARTSQKAAKIHPQQTASRAPLSSPHGNTPDLSPVIAVDTTISQDSLPIYDSPLEAEEPIGTISISPRPASSGQGEEPRPGLHHVTVDTALPDTPLRRQQSDHGAKTIQSVALSLDHSMSAPTPIISHGVLESYKKRFSALEVFPPEPQASVDHLDESSFLTSRLKGLATETALEKVYRPRFHPSEAGDPTEKSDLRSLQRGYWFLDMSTWDSSSRWATWARLHGWISEGAAGWRVWCLRDDPCVKIRTYCWASLAEHVYLLLSHVSDGRVRFMDVEWIGDEGRPRISVPAAAGRGGGV